MTTTDVRPHHEPPSVVTSAALWCSWLAVAATVSAVAGHLLYGVLAPVLPFSRPAALRGTILAISVPLGMAGMYVTGRMQRAVRRG